MPTASTGQLDAIVSMALQIPVVIAFIWFVLKLMREFLGYLKLHDAEWKLFFTQMTDRWAAEQKERDTQWRVFLEREQQRSIDAYHYVADQLKTLVNKVDCLVGADRHASKRQGD